MDEINTTQNQNFEHPAMEKIKTEAKAIEDYVKNNVQSIEENQQNLENKEKKKKNKKR